MLDAVLYLRCSSYRPNTTCGKLAQLPSSGDWTALLTAYVFVCSEKIVIGEEHRLRVFESRVLRRIFGPKRDEVTGDWRKLHNEELHSLYSPPNIIKIVNSRRIRLAGHVARMGS
jgi:hypothetical protein